MTESGEQTQSQNQRKVHVQPTPLSPAPLLFLHPKIPKENQCVLSCVEAFWRKGREGEDLQGLGSQNADSHSAFLQK
jgi:hypothetical protein